MSQPEKQTIAIHQYIYCTVFKSKSNQIMRFDQLIEHDMRNVFIEKLYSKCGGKTIIRPFSLI